MNKKPQLQNGKEIWYSKEVLNFDFDSIELKAMVLVFVILRKQKTQWTSNCGTTCNHIIDLVDDLTDGVEEVWLLDID